MASSPPLDALRAKGLRFVFPSAARLPVTLNGGMLMPAWFDLTSLSDIDADEDDDGLAQSAAYVQSLLDAELAAGVPRARLFVAGFSQGGAVALAVALRQAEPLGGVLALSTWLAGRAAFPASLGAGARATPVFWAHGTHDGVVKTEYGQRSAAALRAMGLEVAWHTYPMAHSACPEEMQDAHDWLTSRL